MYRMQVEVVNYSLFSLSFLSNSCYNVYYGDGRQGEIKSEGIQHYCEAAKLYGRKERYHGRSAVPSQ